MYAAVRRQGLDRASKKDITYCTTWLREHGWRRVQKRFPDGQRVVVWRAFDPDSRTTQGPELGSASAEKASQEADHTDAANVVDGANAASIVADVGQERPKADPTFSLGRPGPGQKTITGTALSSLFVKEDPTRFSEVISQKQIHSGAQCEFCFEVVRGKIALGLPSPDDLLPTTLADLEEAFPRDRFLSFDVETTGLHAARDTVRTAQFSDGESVAILVFDRPVPARALVVLADFLRGRRVTAHNARFESSWLREAGIDLVLDDTVLLFSAVRGTRLPKGNGHIGGGSGRVSLAALATMVLGETLDKSEQVSDWAAPQLTPEQIAYALNDAVVTHRIWEALRAELHRKSEQHGVDISAGYEDLRYSAAMSYVMERTGIGFDVATHQAWVARKQEPVAALEAHLATLDPTLTPKCIASGVQLDKLFRQRIGLYPDKEQRRALLKWPKTEKTRRLAFGREDLEAVILADRLLPAEKQLVDTLWVRARDAQFLTSSARGS
jgi:ribonuclease D